MNYWKCMGWIRRLEGDELVNAQHAALEEMLETGEVLSVSPTQWMETLENFAENGVATREDVEKLVFEDTMDDRTNGVLEEVILVAAIWENLKECVDTNKDEEISREEWMALEGKDIPVPTTPEVFKNIFKQGDNIAIKSALVDFFMASVTMGPGSEESAEEELVMEELAE